MDFLVLIDHKFIEIFNIEYPRCGVERLTGLWSAVAFKETSVCLCKFARMRRLFVMVVLSCSCRHKGDIWNRAIIAASWIFGIQILDLVASVASGIV